MKYKAKAATRSIEDRNKNRFLAGLLMVLASLMILALSGAPAKSGEFPQCHDVPVEKRILRDYAWAEKNTWFRGIDLVRLSKMHEHRVTQNENSPVIRRYCMATGHLSNGYKRSVYYLIENVGGFAGQTWNVTHCVIDLDHWRNHDGNCRALR